jgi:hypothetical protein
MPAALAAQVTTPDSARLSRKRRMREGVQLLLRAGRPVGERSPSAMAAAIAKARGVPGASDRGGAAAIESGFMIGSITYIGNLCKLSTPARCAVGPASTATHRRWRSKLPRAFAIVTRPSNAALT